MAGISSASGFAELYHHMRRREAASVRLTADQRGPASPITGKVRRYRTGLLLLSRTG
jgi:hypothetical protein